MAVRSTGEGIAAGDEVGEDEGVAVGEDSALDAGDGARLACTGDGEPPDAEHAVRARLRTATSVRGTSARGDGNDEPAARATGRDERRFEMDRRGGRSVVTWPT